MAKYPFEEFTTVVWVPGADGIADIDAPTEEEIAAGTDISCDLTADGLSLGVGTNSIAAGSLCNRVDSQVPGKVTFSPSLTGFRFSPPDEEPLWDLAAWNTAGFLVIRRGIQVDTAFADGQQVEVYEALMGEPGMADSGGDTLTTFTLPLFIDDFNQKAFVGGVS